MFKSDAEIALMKKANEVTLSAYQHVYKHLETGMEPGDVKALMAAAQSQRCPPEQSRSGARTDQRIDRGA